MQLESLTKEEESHEEQQIIEWILENEPQIIVEISKFWLYNSFTLSKLKGDDDET